MITVDPAGLAVFAHELSAAAAELGRLAAAGQAVLADPAVGLGAVRSPVRVGRAFALGEPGLVGLAGLAAGHEALAADVRAQLGLARSLALVDTAAGVGLEASLRAGDVPLSAGRWALDRLLPEGAGVVSERRAPAGPVTPTIAGLFARAGTLAEGELEVVPVTGLDGAVRYAVLLRGIEGLLNPTVNTAVQAVKTSQRRTDAYSRAAAQALRLAGVPAGAEVLVAGHSQGGIAALNLAAAGGWRVTHVITAGSPVGNKRLPAGTRLLRIENRGDPVPQLDGDREPGPYLYSFGRDLRISHAVSAHLIGSGYLPELESARFAADPGVREFSASARVLGGEPGRPRRFLLEAGRYGRPPLLGGQ